MFGLFASRNEQQNADTDVESEIEDYVPFKRPLHTKKATIDGHEFMMEIHVETARNMIPCLRNWCYNRAMDEKHVRKLRKVLEDSSHKHFINPILVVKDEDRYKVVNGQHRIQALAEYFEGDIDMVDDMELSFEVYIPTNPDDDTAIDTIFEFGNRNLVFKETDNVEKKTKEIIKRLVALFPLAIDTKMGRKNRPKIAKKDLYELFKVNLKSTKSVDVLVDEIKRINNSISIMERSKVFGEKAYQQDREWYDKHFAKAKRCGFFLNMKSVYSPTHWLAMLNKLG